LEFLLDQRTALEAQIHPPRRVLAIADGTGENDRVHIRGDVRKLGDETPRGFLTAFGPSAKSFESGSGRLALAEKMITSPLLSRVIVNRVWQHHFGEGIVRTPDDFGAMGERPTHPELLDYLANQFIKDGWSLKRLHRTILLSAAYGMS